MPTALVRLTTGVVYARSWSGTLEGATLSVDTITLDSTNDDVSLSRGAANRLDLASGDSLNLVAGELSLAQGTITTDLNAISSTATWNAGAVAFTAWELNVTNTASAGTSNLIDLQVGGTTQFKVRLDGQTTINDNFFLPAVGYVSFTGRSAFRSSADGIINLFNNAQTDFTRINFGGTTSSFPGLSRNGATIETKLADDSAYAAHTASIFNIGGAAAVATSAQKVIKKVTAIADNTATAVFTVTIPNANHAAAIKCTFLSSNGSTDAFESSRVATGHVVVARTTGANAVTTAATIDDAAIATVAAGATHLLTYGVSAVSGAAGASNTFTIQVTIDDSGNLGSNQVVAIAEIINSEATGVTIS